MFQVEDSRAAVLVGGPIDGVRIPTIGAAHMRRVPAQPVVDPVVDSSRLALLVYTSGSTGRPEGVMLDHANLEAMATQMASHFQLTPADHALLVLPPFHVNSLCVSFLAPVVAGAQVTVLDRLMSCGYARGA
nr:AMP-binding protein [Microbacterium aurum]